MLHPARAVTSSKQELTIFIRFKIFVTKHSPGMIICGLRKHLNDLENVKSKSLGEIIIPWNYYHTRRGLRYKNFKSYKHCQFFFRRSKGCDIKKRLGTKFESSNIFSRNKN